jgi:hypothetical protein
METRKKALPKTASPGSLPEASEGTQVQDNEGGPILGTLTEEVKPTVELRSREDLRMSRLEDIVEKLTQLFTSSMVEPKNTSTSEPQAVTTSEEQLRGPEGPPATASVLFVSRFFCSNW